MRVDFDIELQVTMLENNESVCGVRDASSSCLLHNELRKVGKLPSF